MSGKVGLTFSFAKKAEPKRVVEALAKKKDDGRIAITGVEDGQVTVDGPQAAAKQLTIPCKNPLQERAKPAAARAVASSLPPARPEGETSQAAAEEEGGLRLPPGRAAGTVAAPVSAEDVEALRELQREAGGGGEGLARGGALNVAPILMREGSKRVRDGDAPDASKDMFDKVPIDSFGEAMLRGMGFDPAKHTTKPVFHEKPRDNLLGLGAKPLLPSERAAAKAKAAGGAAARAAAAASLSSQGSAAAAEPASPPAPPPDGGSEGRSVPPDASSPAAPPAADDARPAKRRHTEAAAVEQDAASAAPGADLWPSRGLLVRVRGRARELREIRGAEAVVLELDAATGLCRVKARVDGESRVLHGVPPSELEPTVGAECTTVRVIRGPHRGAEAKLVRRSARQEAAWVVIDGSERQLPLADVCEFMASRR